MNPYPKKHCPRCGQEQHSGRAKCVVTACGYRFYKPKPPANKGVRGETRNRGRDNGANKLTEAQVRDIRARLMPYINTAQIAAEFGIHKRTALAIYNRETWQWLND